MTAIAEHRHFLRVRPARLLARYDRTVKQAGMAVWRTG